MDGLNLIQLVNALSEVAMTLISNFRALSGQKDQMIASLMTQVSELREQNVKLTQDNAQLSAALAEALSNDKADQEKIDEANAKYEEAQKAAEAAQAEASGAEAKAAELQQKLEEQTQSQAESEQRLRDLIDTLNSEVASQKPPVVDEPAPTPVENPAPAPEGDGSASTPVVEEPAPAPVEEPAPAPVEEPAPAPEGGDSTPF